MKPKKGTNNNPGNVFRGRLPGTGIHRVCWEDGRITIPIACVNAGTGLSPSETGEWILSYHSSANLMLLPKIVWGQHGEEIRAYLEQEFGQVSDRSFWTLFVAPAKRFVMGTKRRVTIPKPSLTQYINFAKGDQNISGGKGDKVVIILPGISYFLITGVPDHLKEQEKAQPVQTMPTQETPDGVRKRDERGS